VNECNILLYSNILAKLVCSSFDPAIALHIFRKFESKRILDFCAGWGDRLIAAIAHNASYTGIDINGDLFKGYKDCIDQLVD